MTTLDTYICLAEFDWRDQPRAPAGEADGGRWVSSGGASTAGEAFASPVHNFKAKSGTATAAEVNALRSHLHSLTTEQLRRLAAEHDVPHAGRDKAKLVSELHKAIVAHREGPAKPQEPDKPLGNPLVYTEGKAAGLQAFRPTREELLKIWSANPAMTEAHKRQSLAMNGVDPASAEGKSILEAAGVKAAPAPAPVSDKTGEVRGYYDAKASKSSAIHAATVEKAKREEFRKAAVHLLDKIGHRFEARRLEQGFIPKKLHPATAQHLIGVAEQYGVTLPAHVYQAAASKSTVRYTPGFHEAAEFADVLLF